METIILIAILVLISPLMSDRWFDYLDNRYQIKRWPPFSMRYEARLSVLQEFAESIKEWQLVLHGRKYLFHNCKDSLKVYKVLLELRKLKEEAFDKSTRLRKLIGGNNSLSMRFNDVKDSYWNSLNEITFL